MINHVTRLASLVVLLSISACKVELSTIDEKFDGEVKKILDEIAMVLGTLDTVLALFATLLFVLGCIATAFLCREILLTIERVRQFKQGKK